jgi:hypothetical protein
MPPLDFLTSQPTLVGNKRKVFFGFFWFGLPLRGCCDMLAGHEYLHKKALLVVSPRRGFVGVFMQVVWQQVWIRFSQKIVLCQEVPVFRRLAA